MATKPINKVKMSEVEKLDQVSICLFQLYILYHLSHERQRGVNRSRRYGKPSG
jgi:hypothetical protein